MNEKFRKFSHCVSELAGTSWAFLAAAIVVVIWIITGPVFHYSDTWQLVINTGTTIITFLMVFLIQNTQNRDSKAIQLKLDELIRAVDTARDDMIDIEELSDAQLKQLQSAFRRLSPNDMPAEPVENAIDKKFAEGTRENS
jgi:low affinity Fe/Cu permease